jgi:hypothetical protein
MEKLNDPKKQVKAKSKITNSVNSLSLSGSLSRFLNKLITDMVINPTEKMPNMLAIPKGFRADTYSN